MQYRLGPVIIDDSMLRGWSERRSQVGNGRPRRESDTNQQRDSSSARRKKMPRKTTFTWKEHAPTSQAAARGLASIADAVVPAPGMVGAEPFGGGPRRLPGKG